MAVEGIVGYPGSGKSLYAAVMAFNRAEDAKLDPPSCRRRVLCNFPVAHDGVDLFTTWAHLADGEVYNADVFIDEAHLWFPARQFQQFGKVEDMVHWAQHRHDDNNLWWIAQSPGQIDVQIREMFTDHITRCQRLLPPRGRRCRFCRSRRHSTGEHLFGHWVLVRKYEAHDYGKETKQTRVQRHIVRVNKWFGVYDTTYTVGDRLGNGARYGRGHLASEAASGRAASRLSQESYLANTVAYDAGRSGVTRWQPSLDQQLSDMMRERHTPDPAPDAPEKHALIPPAALRRQSRPVEF